MNVINAVLATATTPASSNSSAARGNGSTNTAASAAHSNSVRATNEGYTALPSVAGGGGQGSSSCSSSSSESSSDDRRRHHHHHSRLSFPGEESRWSQEIGSPDSSELDAPTSSNSLPDKTDCQYSNRAYASVSSGASQSTSAKGLSSESNTSTSSLNLSNPNIAAGQYSSGDFSRHDPHFLHSVQSLEHDLDYILENRDLNPFYEDGGGRGSSALRQSDDQMITMDKGGDEEGEDDEDDDCDFNVEDYLVDLDQYLDEQEQRTAIQIDQDPSSTTLDRRILRKPNTNRTLPRNLSESSKSELKRKAANRNSVHLGKVPNDGQPVSRRRSLWLRNSMRKTKLIPLPNQIEAEATNSRNSPEEASSSLAQAQAHPSTEPLSSLTTGSILPRAENQGVTSAMDPVGDFLAFNRITFDPPAQQRPTNTFLINEDRQRSSEPVPNQNVRDVPILQTNAEFNYLDEPFPPTAPVFDQLVPQTHSQSQPPPLTLPRQLGRRSELHPRVVAINAESNTIVLSHNNNQVSRPTSAPARVGLVASTTTTNSESEEVRRTARDRNHRGVEFDSLSSVASSRNPSPVSLASTSGSSMTSANNGSPERTTTTVPESSSSSARRSDQNEAGTVTATNRTPSEFSQEDQELKTKMWPHDLGSALAIISCTLGVFNISRFAVFSVHFGANFIVQFLILSIVFGIPMLWLQMCLGAKIQRGPVSMWKISPISRGIGIVLLLVQGLIGLYSAISISWLLVYFRDAFETNTNLYKWQETVEMYRPGGTNESMTLAQTVPDYFNGIVLQRYNLGPAGRVGFSSIGKVRFQLAFNLSLFWTIIFIILCKGLRSYGKFVFPLIMLPLIGLTAFTTKLLMMIDFSSIENLFPATDWDDFFVNSNSWMTAAQETFLTWGLFGASVLSMSSHGMKKKGSTVRRDALFVVIITLYGLILAGVIGNACVQIIKDNGYLYYPGSFETLSSNVFLYSTSQPIPNHIISVPPKWLPRFSTILGEAMKQPGTVYHKESGYQVLRLITEIIPSAFGAATQEVVSPWWCLLGITSLVLLAVAQFCAIWKPISTILGSNPSSVLLSCVTGLLLGIPLSTETGLQIVYFLEVTLGGAWWVLIIWFGQIIALFLIRGRPYTGDLIIKDMKLGNTISTFVALSWNILIPIGLMFLCVFQYQVSDMGKFLHWKGISYWPLWARKLGGIIQITMLQIVPVTAVLQIYRFLSKGPPDILERIQLLYRPDVDLRRRSSVADRRSAETIAVSPSITTIPLEVPITPIVPDDVPPKYTPPPSYTTATGARIAKMLRASIRRSVRRIMGEPGNSRGHRSNLSDHIAGLNSGLGSSSLEDNCATVNMGPPSYASVNIDLSLNTLTSLVPSMTTNSVQQSGYAMPPPIQPILSSPGDLLGDKNRRPATSPTTPTNSNCVPNFLRPQRYLHSNRSLSLSGCVDQAMARNSFRGNANHFFNRRNAAGPVLGYQSRSLENLVLNSAAIGQSSAMTTLQDYSPDITNDDVVHQQMPQHQLSYESGDQEQQQQGRRSSRESNKSTHNSTSSVI